MAEALEVHIRPARDSDLPDLEWEGEYRRYRRLYQLAMQEAHQGRRILFVAEVGGEIVGQIFVQFSFNRPEYEIGVPTGYLQSFRIKMAFRNHGIGTRLINQAEDSLRERDFRRAVIAVAKENHGARRLYERLGYTILAEDPGQWSFIDDQGQLQHVFEPIYLMQKLI